jgi:hypothetical protein
MDGAKYRRLIAESRVRVVTQCDESFRASA